MIDEIEGHFGEYPLHLAVFTDVAAIVVTTAHAVVMRSIEYPDFVAGLPELVAERRPHRTETAGYQDLHAYFLLAHQSSVNQRPVSRLTNALIRILP